MLKLHPWEFDNYTIAEYETAVIGYCDYIDQPMWERAAFLGCCTLQPWSKRPLTVDRLLGRGSTQIDPAAADPYHLRADLAAKRKAFTKPHAS